jgi:hypothetical protein
VFIGRPATPFGRGSSRKITRLDHAHKPPNRQRVVRWFANSKRQMAKKDKLNTKRHSIHVDSCPFAFQFASIRGLIPDLDLCVIVSLCETH